MQRKKLTFEDRLKIVRWERQQALPSVIAKSLDRNRSIIYKTLSNVKKLYQKRPELCQEDSFTVARILTEEASTRKSIASRKKMRLKNETIRQFVEEKLKNYWTPETIANRLSIEHKGEKISYEAIYQWINEERPELKEYLPIAGKSRKRRRTGKKQRKPLPVSVPKKSIEIRPLDINKRIRIGDFELDAVLSCKGALSALQVLVDRRTRKVFLQRVSCLETEHYCEKLIKRIHCDIPRIHSITSDNGSEHWNFYKVESCLNIEWFFCHPYCASERGTVENRNKVIRRFFPKGTNFDEIPDDFIQWLEDFINNYPLGVLNYQTPNETWMYELKLAA